MFMCVTFFEEYEDQRSKRHAPVEAGTAGFRRGAEEAGVGEGVL